MKPGGSKSSKALFRLEVEALALDPISVAVPLEKILELELEPALGVGLELELSLDKGVVALLV